jgi:glycosyltransferase involved in cell wall biosynthesis
MKIGLNLLYLLPGIVGGTETYAAGLLHGLVGVDPHDRFLVFVNQESADWYLPNVSNIQRVICPVKATSRIRRYLFEQFQLPALLKKHSVDLVHSLGYVSPLFSPCPTIVTIHDLNYRAFGGQMPWNRRIALEVLVRQSALRSHHVITDSQFVCDQIMQLFRLPSSRVAVVYAAPKVLERGGAPSRCREYVEKLDIRSPFCLAFGNRGANKNVGRLVKAFLRAQTLWALPHQLVIVGHLAAADLPTDVRHLIPQSICLAGYVDDATLQSLWADAQMLIVPSLYEGFGLPVLEGMSMGVPVICSNAASLPEVAGDAAVFFDPLSVAEMSQKIAQVALDQGLRDELRQRGLANIRRFSWKKSATRVLEIYAQVVEKGMERGES